MALLTQDLSVQSKSSSGGITYTYILRLIENSIDEVSNTSNVTIQAILKSSYSGASFNNYGIGVSCKLNEEQIFSDYKSRSCTSNAEQVYYTWTGDIAHNDDGTLDINVSGEFWIVENSATYTPKNMSIASQKISLTTIIRGFIYLKIDGVRKHCTPFLKVNGTWKKACAYIKANSKWNMAK